MGPSSRRFCPPDTTFVAGLGLGRLPFRSRIQRLLVHCGLPLNGRNPARENGQTDWLSRFRLRAERPAWGVSLVVSLLVSRLLWSISAVEEWGENTFQTGTA